MHDSCNRLWELAGSRGHCPAVVERFCMDHLCWRQRLTRVMVGQLINPVRLEMDPAPR